MVVTDMAKRSHKKTSTRKVSASGAKGGPSTGHGLNYQIDLAIQLTLEYMFRALCAPGRSWNIRIEPRVSASDELVAWDFGFEPDDEWFEAKLKPTPDDLQEWVERIAAGSTATQRFHLVYSKGAGKHLVAIDRLIRLGIEANGNEAEFRTKIQAEEVDANDPYLVALGDNAHDLLMRMTVEQVPEYILKSTVDLRARQLVGAVSGTNLREFLFTKFHEAIPHRLSFSVTDLLDEARLRGIQFPPPAELDTSDLSQTARAALIILQVCKEGLSTRVIAGALDRSEAEIESELEELKNSHIVTLEGSLWSMKPLPTPLSASNSEDILANALSNLLKFIDDSSANVNLHPHVRNVISLASACRLSHPRLVARVFTRLDKRLKQIGNKRLVWFVANMSIQAARAVRLPDEETAEAAARALICGTSWAFQRLHKIPKARVDADEAYELSKDMGLDRTLAFCIKCRGRLCRLEAENLPAGEQKEAKLRESVELLNSAIHKFSELAAFGPDHPEVGDCYSLLGRTYLRMGTFREAWEAIKKAYDLIVDKTSKDYLDLVILNGDLEAARGNRTGATPLYDEAMQISISSDLEISEMRARAYYRSGLNEEATGNSAGALERYRAAKNIWGSLQDEQFEAQAAWRILCLSDNLSNNAIHRLNEEAEDVRVRVEAATMHINSLAQTRAVTVGQRSESPPGYWRQLVKQAKQRLALRGQRSEREW
jgi:tetratricopeptide (TPR) repeat protein/DNA-binding NarL/FixJ family response regulator